MKGFFILTVFFTILSINSGCVYVPLPAHDLRSVKGVIDNEVIRVLKPGETTRGDLLLLVGAPDERYEQDRYFIYEWEVTEGVWFFAIFGVGGYQDHVELNYLCVEFDEDNRLLRHAHIKSGHFKSALEAHNEMLNWRHGPDK